MVEFLRFTKVEESIFSCEKELTEFAKHHMSDEEYASYDLKSNINKMLGKMDRYISELSSCNKTLREYYNVDEPNSFFISEEIVKINGILRRAVRNIYDIGLYSGSMKKEERKQILGENLEFSLDGEHLHINFPSLLPRRIKNDSPITSADVKQMYEEPFYQFFSSGKHKIYAKKAVIIYTHVFSSEKEFVDHDNFQTKEVTDLITSWLLLDDTPKNCAIFMDYKMGEKSHTEVDVIPFDKLKDFLQK